MRLWLWTLLILLTAFLLRLYGLGDKEMWYDEAFAVLYAEKEPASIVYGTVTPVEGAAADIHPLLYYFFLHGWMGLGQSPFVVRFPSVAFGLLSLCLVFRLARELFDPRVGLLAAALTAMSPFHIWYSQEARMYSLLCLLGLVSIYFFVRAWKADRWRYWTVFGLFAGLSLYVHNLAFLVLVTLDLVAVAHKKWNMLTRLVAANCVAVVMFLPWLALVPGQLAKVGQAYWIPRPGPTELVRTLIVFTFNLPLPDWLLSACLFYSLLLLALVLYRNLRPARTDGEATSWPTSLALALSFLPPVLMFLVSQIRAVYIERAVLVSALLYYVVASRAALRGRLPRLVIATLLPVPALLIGSLWYQSHYDQFPRSPFRVADSYLAERYKPGDVVVHDSKLSFFPSHYYDRNLPQTYVGDVPGSPTDTLALPTQEVLGLVAQQDMAHAVGDSPRVWFVVFQRALDEAEELGVENPNKAWLDSHYHLTDVVVFHDLRVLLYTQP
jgi:hypothetical protein